MTRPTARRRLTPREADVLEHLLAVEAPAGEQAAVGALRESVSRLVVVGRWDCCPSIDLAFSFDGPLPEEAGPPLIEAWHRSKPYQLLLFPSVDGAIRTLELVHYDEDEVDELPRPDEWKAPSIVDY